MPNVVVIGTQWGDEGKGRIVDLIAEDVYAIVRYQGGNNAGHTIVIGDQTIILHHIPSGILREGKISVIGNGVVIDPNVLLGEIDTLKSAGYRVDGSNLKISDRAHVIMPYHREIDRAREEKRGNRKIGTTGRGIGPVYEDKAARRGIRVADIADPKLLRERLPDILEDRNQYIAKVLGGNTLSLEEIYDQYIEYGRKISPFITDSSTLLNTVINKGKNILFEGAQGALLDIDFGTYPFVTSSSASSGGASTGTGVSPTKIDTILGVAKAYTTRVGEGPFPTEIEGELGEKLRELGGEYGATTGRQRRCGWFDAVAFRYAAMINGVSHIALTKLDVLSGFDSIKICVSYNHNGNTLTDFPTSNEILANSTPVYEELEGWDKDISNIRTYEDLPSQARDYLKKVEEVTKTPISMVSLGPSRDEIIFMRDIL